MYSVYDPIELTLSPTSEYNCSEVSNTFFSSLSSPLAPFKLMPNKSLEGIHTYDNYDINNSSEESDKPDPSTVNPHWNSEVSDAFRSIPGVSGASSSTTPYDSRNYASLPNVHAPATYDALPHTAFSPAAAVAGPSSLPPGSFSAASGLAASRSERYSSLAHATRSYAGGDYISPPPVNDCSPLDSLSYFPPRRATISQASPYPTIPRESHYDMGASYAGPSISPISAIPNTGRLSLDAATSSLNATEHRRRALSPDRGVMPISGHARHHPYHTTSRPSHKLKNGSSDFSITPAIPSLPTVLPPPPVDLSSPGPDVTSSPDDASSSKKKSKKLPRDALAPLDKTFLCKLCGVGFARNHDLTRHYSGHQRDKHFKCDGCSKAFTRKDALKRHSQTKKCGEAQFPQTGGHARRKNSKKAKQELEEEIDLVLSMPPPPPPPPAQTAPTSPVIAIPPSRPAPSRSVTSPRGSMAPFPGARHRDHSARVAPYPSSASRHATTSTVINGHGAQESSSSNSSPTSDYIPRPRARPSVRSPVIARRPAPVTLGSDQAVTSAFPPPLEVAYAAPPPRGSVADGGFLPPRRDTIADLRHQEVTGESSTARPYNSLSLVAHSIQAQAYSAGPPSADHDYNQAPSTFSVFSPTLATARPATTVNTDSHRAEYAPVADEFVAISTGATTVQSLYPQVRWDASDNATGSHYH